MHSNTGQLIEYFLEVGHERLLIISLLKQKIKRELALDQTWAKLLPSEPRLSSQEFSKSAVKL